jgi:hypothetical protein
VCIGVRGWIGDEFGPDDFRAQGVAFLRSELLLRALLQMCRLRFHEQLIDRDPAFLGEEVEIDAEFDEREQIERFLRGHAVGMPEDAVAAANVIEQFVGLFLQQCDAGVLFVVMIVSMTFCSRVMISSSFSPSVV